MLKAVARLWQGGGGFETPFGTVYAANLTTDPDFGIGDWAIEDFAKAVRQGLSPDDVPYYPVFTYDKAIPGTEAASWLKVQPIAPHATLSATLRAGERSILAGCKAMMYCRAGLRHPQ